jgi:hypothetical protein
MLSLGFWVFGVFYTLVKKRAEYGYHSSFDSGQAEWNRHCRVFQPLLSRDVTVYDRNEMKSQHSALS